MRWQLQSSGSPPSGNAIDVARPRVQPDRLVRSDLEGCLDPAISNGTFVTCMVELVPVCVPLGEIQEDCIGGVVVAELPVGRSTRTGAYMVEHKGGAAVPRMEFEPLRSHLVHLGRSFAVQELPQVVIEGAADRRAAAEIGSPRRHQYGYHRVLHTAGALSDR